MIKALYKKEISYYLTNPIGYITIVLFGICANFLFVKDLFAVGSASMKPFFAITPWIMLIFIPAITMKAFAEEKRTNTIETLLTLPITELEIVLAKCAAIVTVVAIALGLTLLIPITLVYYSHLYIPEIITGYIGLLLYGSSIISISLFFSSLTKNQVVAFLYSVICIFILLVIATEFTANVLPKFLQDIITSFGFLYHLSNFIKGVIDLRSVIYFVSLFILSIFLTVINLERRG